MAPYVERIVRRLHEAEEDLQREVHEQQRRWRFEVHRGRVRFDRGIRDAHRRMKQGIPAYIREGSLLSLVTAPVVYSLIVPLLVLDVWTTVYQCVCFPIYGVPRVHRRISTMTTAGLSSQ
jgi:hypothetical protein